MLPTGRITRTRPKKGRKRTAEHAERLPPIAGDEGKQATAKPSHEQANVWSARANTVRTFLKPCGAPIGEIIR